MSADLSEQIRKQIDRIEAKARRHDMPIERLQAEIGVHRATWDRWKAGTVLPRLSTWDKVLRAAKQLGSA